MSLRESLPRLRFGLVWAVPVDVFNLFVKRSRVNNSAVYLETRVSPRDNKSGVFLD